ncbi:hypothetical protein FGO68_gene11974 [Halteria grandinella]|uniref:Uncharacterized protein n=1 Tax=Halteria grandinella TaxID=5974 RepID=A0A8J8T070_HALGN|nr:hypothetical protein FGO68_gene11974 [Halteria grandinella]
MKTGIYSPLQSFAQKHCWRPTDNITPEKMLERTLNRPDKGENKTRSTFLLNCNKFQQGGVLGGNFNLNYRQFDYIRCTRQDPKLEWNCNPTIRNGALFIRGYCYDIPYNKYEYNCLMEHLE